MGLDWGLGDSRIWQHHPSEICFSLNQQHKFFSKSDWEQPGKADPFFFYSSPFNKWDSNMNLLPYFNFYFHIYFKSLFGLIKNFYFSFFKYKVWKYPLSRSFKREMVRKAFPHSYLLPITFFSPSLFFLCIFPFAFPFI